MNFIDTFNGREKALIVWIAIGLIFVFINKETRGFAVGVVKAFLNVKILVPFLAMFAYLVLAICFLSSVGLWDVSLLKNTIFWLFGTATVLFFNINKTSQDPFLFKKILLETVGITVFLEFLVGLRSFSFIIEFIVMLFLFPIVVMSGFVDNRDEHKILRRPLKVIVVGYGFFILSYSVLSVLGNVTEFVTVHNLLTLVIPSVLTVLYLPFLYVLALAMTYEVLFVRLGIFIESKELLAFTKRQVLILCLFNLRLLNNFSQNAGGRIMKIKSRQDVRDIIKDFKK